MYHARQSLRVRVTHSTYIYTSIDETKATSHYTIIIILPINTTPRTVWFTFIIYNNIIVGIYVPIVVLLLLLLLLLLQITIVPNLTDNTRMWWWYKHATIATCIYRAGHRAMFSCALITLILWSAVETGKPWCSSCIYRTRSCETRAQNSTKKLYTYRYIKKFENRTDFRKVFPQI